MAPDLKDAGIANSGLLVEVKAIKNQRLALGVKHSSEGLAIASFAIDIDHVRNVELTRAHKLADVPVGPQELLLLRQSMVFFAKLCIELLYLEIDGCETCRLMRTLLMNV